MDCGNIHVGWQENRSIFQGSSIYTESGGPLGATRIRQTWRLRPARRHWVTIWREDHPLRALDFRQTRRVREWSGLRRRRMPAGGAAIRWSKDRGDLCTPELQWIRQVFSEAWMCAQRSWNLRFASNEAGSTPILKFTSGSWHWTCRMHISSKHGKELLRLALLHEVGVERSAAPGRQLLELLILCCWAPSCCESGKVRCQIMKVSKLAKWK